MVPGFAKFAKFKSHENYALYDISILLDNNHVSYEVIRSQYISICTIITLTSKAPPRDLYPMYPLVHQDKLVVLRGIPSKLVVTVVQQLVLKMATHGSRTFPNSQVA